MNIERISQFIEKEGISVRKFEDTIGASNGVIRRAIRNKTDIQSKWITSVLENYPQLNSLWLLTGKGVMMKSESIKNIEIVGEGILDNAEKQRKGVIRYYDVDASASPIEMFNSGSSVEYKDLIIPGFEDCEIALNIWGDSMEPKLCKGEMIICKLWQESFIEFGFVYLIETKTGHRMIKYVQSGQSVDTISCVSENKFYQPFELEKDDILKLYVVKGHLERSML